MRFGNSSNYFGLQSNAPGWMALNTATGKAFHPFAGRMSSALTNLASARRMFSQQCSRHLFQRHPDRFETAARSAPPRACPELVEGAGSRLSQPALP
jgi:hypothetical protein